MSEVAGRLAVQAAARALESPAGGAGILLGGVPGTPAAKVTIMPNPPQTDVMSIRLSECVAAKTTSATAIRAR